MEARKICPSCDSSLTLALLRVSQMEARLLTKYPRASRDGELASVMASLRNELEAIRDGGLDETPAG